MALLFAFATAVVLRVYLIATTESVARDSVTFVSYAKGLRTAPIAEMRSQDQHPLYPASILAVHALVGRWLADSDPFQWARAGQLASMLAAVLGVWGAYLLGKTMWDSRVGVFTALFLAIFPEHCQASGNALSDPLHLALYLLGFVCVLRAMQTGQIAWLGGAGVLSALAFLTRPEGGSILLIGCLIALTGCDRIRWPWKQRLVSVLVLVVCFFAVAGPYMAAVGRLVQKKNLFELFGIERPEQAERPIPLSEPRGEGDRWVRGDTDLPLPLHLLYYWIRSCRVVYWLLAVPALLLPGLRRPFGLWPVLAAMGLHFALLHALHLSYGYVSLRHLLVVSGLTLPFSAATFVWLVDSASAAYAAKKGQPARVVRRSAYVVGTLALIAPTLPWMLEPIGENRGYLTRAGRWLAQHSRPGELVLTTRTRVAFYAGLPLVYGPDTGQIPHILRDIERYRPVYYVIEKHHITANDRNPNFFEDLRGSSLAERLQQIHEEKTRKQTVLIYRVLSGPTSERSTTRTAPEPHATSANGTTPQD